MSALRFARGRAVVGAIALLAGSSVALAGDHPYSRVVHDPATGVSTIDMTMSLEWSAPWVDGTTTIDNAYLEGSVREFARTLFQSTEGRLRLGGVYIYPGKRYLDRVDIYFDRDGRANATPDAFGGPGRMNDFIKFNGLQTQVNIGKEMVHEALHYLTGLLDEYKEDGKPCNPAEPYQPCQDDNPRQTILSDHETFPNLSLPSDYPDEESRRTAQFRVYGASCWEALVRDPAADPPAVKELYGRERRTWVALKGSALPTALPGLTTGFDAALRFVHVTSLDEITVYVVDVRVSEEALQQAKDALAAAVERASVGTSVAVFTFPSATTAPVVAMTRIDGGTERTQIRTAVAGIVMNTEGTADVSERLGHALDAIEAAARADGVPATIFTALESDLVPTADIAKRLRDARVSTSVLALGNADPPAGAPGLHGAGESGAGASITLAELARQTRGSFRRVTDPDTLATDMAAAVAEDDGENVAQMGEAFAETLPSGENLELAVFASSPSIDGAITFEADLGTNAETDADVVLRAPDGTEHRQDSLSGGVELESEPGDEVAVFTVPAGYAGRQGAWRLTVTALADLADSVSLAAFSESALDVDVVVEDDLRVRVTVMGEQSMLGARVRGQLHDADGIPVGGEIAFADDGVLPDGIPDDAMSFASLADPCRPAGELELVVSVDNPSGTAGYGVKAFGVELDAVDAVPPFSRLASEWLSIDASGDPDGDGACGGADNCPGVVNAGQEDADGDGLGDACDACPADAANDGDRDAVCGNVDNCRPVPNTLQADDDGDGRGDACHFEWGDVVPRGGPGRIVTIADVVGMLRLDLALDPVTPDLLARGNVAPSNLLDAGPPEVHEPNLDMGDWMIDDDDVEMVLSLALGRTTMPAPR